MHLIKGLKLLKYQIFPVNCNSAFRVHICVMGLFLQLLCSTGLPWVKYRLLMIVVRGCNLYKCTICTKRGKLSHSVRGCFSMMEKLFRLTHYSSQFKNRELAQWFGTSKVQLTSCHVNELKYICSDCRQRKMSIDVSKVLFYQVMSMLLGKRLHLCS